MNGLHISIHPDSETVVVIRELSRGFEVAALILDTVYDIIGTTRMEANYSLPAYTSPDGIGDEYFEEVEIDLSSPDFELTTDEVTAIFNYCQTNLLFKKP